MNSKSKKNNQRLKTTLFIISGLLPVVIYFSIFSIYPVISALNISLRNYGLLDKKHPFIGLKNYTWALSDKTFWLSMGNTVYYAVFFVALCFVFGILLALMVNTLRDPFKSFMRGIIFTPVVTSMVAVSLMFLWLYQPSFGVINYVLSWIGLGPFGFLNNSQEVIPSLILMGVWKQVGYYMVIFLAGLTTIPTELYEAANVDGSNPVWNFFKITMPLLKPTVLFVMVTGMISAFQVFTQIYIMTGGGPGTASRTIVMHIYETGFKFFEMGRASAIAFLLFAVIMIITLFQIKFLKSNVEY